MSNAKQKGGMCWTQTIERRTEGWCACWSELHPYKTLWARPGKHACDVCLEAGVEVGAATLQPYGSWECWNCGRVEKPREVQPERACPECGNHEALSVDGGSTWRRIDVALLGPLPAVPVDETEWRAKLEWLGQGRLF